VQSFAANERRVLELPSLAEGLLAPVPSLLSPTALTFVLQPIEKASHKGHEPQNADLLVEWQRYCDSKGEVFSIWRYVGVSESW
jgi:hypothetical protein